ncbi:MAG: sugar transferase [Betaproteobacteria bacterium]
MKALAKRAFDLSWAAVGLLVLTPLFVVVALLIKFEDGGPALFVQERVGRRGRLFHMWKFRTMRVGAEQQGGQLTVGQDPRVTHVGAWLRKTKVDELPQLINVLRGEMSLVGPRPEVPRYVSLYTPEQRKVLELVPGITDPASVRYRHESELLAQSSDPERTYIEKIMPDKIAINLAYAARATVWSDLLVILNTFVSLVR